MKEKQHVIKLENICKYYQVGIQTVKALHNVSLSIYKNEYVALMGASGSGKSTLMNIVGCLDTPTSGSYELNNQDVSKLSENELAEIEITKLDLFFRHLICYHAIQL